MAKLSALMETSLISRYNHSWMTQSGSTITQSWHGPKLCRAVKEVYASEVSVEYATHTWEEGQWFPLQRVTSNMYNLQVASLASLAQLIPTRSPT